MAPLSVCRSRTAAHLAERARPRVELEHVDRVVVAADLRVAVSKERIFPRLGQGAVIAGRADFGLVLVETKLALFGVLCDGVVRQRLVDFVLGGGPCREAA